MNFLLPVMINLISETFLVLRNRDPLHEAIDTYVYAVFYMYLIEIKNS